MVSPTHSRRALVIRIGALGDVLLTRRLTYSLGLAGYRSTLVAPRRHAFLASADPWIERVVDSESTNALRAFSGDSGNGSEYDAAVVISQSDELRAFAEKSAAHVVRISPSPLSEDVPISRAWARAAADLAFPFEGALPDLAPARGRALREGAVLLHPGSGSRRKNWPLDRFENVARRLSGLGHPVTWIFGPAEDGLTPGESTLDRIDGPDLGDLAATIAVSRLFIGNDSGVAHLAGATGARTLAIFGPTNDRVWAPDGRQVRTLRAASGRLEDVGEDEVIAAARALL